MLVSCGADLDLQQIFPKHLSSTSENKMGLRTLLMGKSVAAET